MDENRKAKIIAAFEKTLGRPLPALVDRKQIEKLGIRSKLSLERDDCCGTSLIKPLGRIGGKMKYLLDDLIELTLAAADD